ALLEALGTDSTLVRYRAVEALGHIGDARAVEPLLALRKIYDPDILQASHAAILVLANHLGEHPSPSEIPQLIALIRQLRLDDQLQAAAISAALALETLARTQPTPALRGALKLLKPSFWAPLPAEFKEAYQTIEDATAQWKDLPLIADVPQTIENLPVPADENNSSDSHD
uniref:HEAT repeat domain-containing protein n=1 Tax=Armatimonas sp. TaxID=1872638 RepID=UPI00375326D8